MFNDVLLTSLNMDISTGVDSIFSAIDTSKTQAKVLKDRINQSRRLIVSQVANPRLGKFSHENSSTSIGLEAIRGISRVAVEANLASKTFDEVKR